MKLAYNVNRISLDINLMQKRQHNYSLVILCILLIFVAMGASSVFGWLWYEEQSKLANAKQQLAEATRLTSALEMKLKENTSSGQLDNVLKQPNLLKQQRPVTTQLLTQLNRLLPLYANVTQLEMNEQGILKLTLYFATSEDVISFSQTVQASDHFKLVRMGTINNVPNTIGNAVAASAIGARIDKVQPSQEGLPQEQQSQAPVREQPLQGQPLQGQQSLEQPVQEQLLQEQLSREQPVQEQPSQEQPLQEKPAQERVNSIKLPVYQTTFELKYMIDGKRG
jgi:hypothetical protein